MALTLLVNAILLAIPLGGSVGTLVGIDAHLAATGQKPLFSSDGTSDGSGGSSGGSTGGGSGGSGSTTNNGLTNTQYCKLSYGISPPSQGEQYTRELILFYFQSSPVLWLSTFRSLIAAGNAADRSHSQSQPVGCDRLNYRCSVYERKSTVSGRFQSSPSH